MSEIVNLSDPGTELARLIERAAEGEDIVIASAGHPMVPLDREPRKSGQLTGLSMPDGFFDPLPEDELKLWE